MAIERIQSLLGGTWRGGEKPGATLVNPATEELLATADGDTHDFGSALEHARTEGGSALRKLTFEQRADMIGKISAALHAVRESLIDSAVANGGCTRGDAKFDVDGAIAVFAHYAELGKTLGARKILVDDEGIQLGRSPRFWGQHAFVPRHGVALLINAFNFPAWGFAEKAACALLAGMPVVTKPATATSLTAWKVTQVLDASGVVPKGVLSFIGGSAAAAIDHLDTQDVLAFTGSADTANNLKRHPRVIERSVRVNIEADSLNASVLGPDVAFDSDAMQLFLRDVARDMTQKTGQKCTAVRRILLPAGIAKDVEAELAARLEATKIGNPVLKEVGMGPVATANQLHDVKHGVARLREEAEIVSGDPEKRPNVIGVEAGKGYFVTPVLLRSRDSANARVVHMHEVFGPVATILPYSGSAEEASALVRRGGGGLVASVYSDDRAFTEAMFEGIGAFSGRLYLGSGKVLEHATGPGLVLPSCVHGGPGRAGGGEELGGVRGVEHFMQRVVLQGSRPSVELLTDTKPGA